MLNSSVAWHHFTLPYLGGTLALAGAVHAGAAATPLQLLALVQLGASLSLLLGSLSDLSGAVASRLGAGGGRSRAREGVELSKVLLLLESVRIQICKRLASQCAKMKCYPAQLIK